MALITSDCDETRPRASNGPNHLSARRPYQVRSKRLEQREVLEALSVAGAESGAGMDGEARAAVSVSFSFYNVVVLVVVVVLSFSLVLSPSGRGVVYLSAALTARDHRTGTSVTPN